jgi:hypothetical protein
MHLEMRVLFERGEGDQHIAALERETLFGSTVRALRPHRPDQLLEVVGGRAGSKGAPQIRARPRVQAHEPDPVCREPASIARRAKWLGGG